MADPLDISDRLVRLLDSAEIGLYQLDGETGLAQLTPGAQAILAAPGARSDYLGLMGNVHEDDFVRVSQEVGRVLREGGTFRVEHRLAHDPARWVRVQGAVALPPEKPWGLTGMVIDITEQKLAAAQVAESLARHQLLVDAAPIGIVVHTEGKLAFVNEAAAAMLGHDPDEILGRTALEFVAPQYRRAAMARIEAVLAEVGRAEPLVEEHFVRADGSYIPVLVTGARTLWNGKPAVQVLFVDLSSQKELEDQLRHSQRLESLGRLAGGVAHDFNNLLTVMLGAAEFIGSTTADPQVIEAVQSIGTAANRGVGITRQLLSFARQETFQPRPVEVCEMLENSRALLVPLLGESINLDLDCLGQHWTRIDPVQLDQVIVNLAINARDAMPEGGRLTIRVGQSAGAQGPELRIEVQDDGVGMAPEVVERVFEPFYTTKPVGQGTGLGLSTSMGIVEQVSGRIEVLSVVGQGTRFTIVLPSIEPPSDHGHLDDAISLDASGPRPLLLVEDDALVRGVIAEALQLRGYQIVVAGDGVEAQRVLDGIHRLEAVICDVVLPGANGPEVVAQIRERFPRVGALLVSGYSPDRLDRNVLGEHTRFLQKPYTVTQLVTALEELLGR